MQTIRQIDGFSALYIYICIFVAAQKALVGFQALQTSAASKAGPNVMPTGLWSYTNTCYINMLQIK